MKRFLMSLILMPMLATANVYLENTKVPSELQNRIVEAVSVQCPGNTGLRELDTQEREESIDQGIRDYYFTTTFETSFFNADGHTDYERIVVESAEFQISNPSVDRFSVDSIRATYVPGRCR